MADLSNHLHRLADSADERVKEKRQNGPYRLDVDGQPWAMASDAKSMFFTNDCSGGYELLLMEGGKIRKAIVGYFYPPTEGAYHTVSLAALKEFCGAPVWEEECPECKGTSATSEMVSCSACDCDGMVRPDVRSGYLYGLAMDRGLLACLLEPLEEDQWAKVYTVHRGILWVVGDDWRVVLMGVTPPTSEMDADYDAWQVAPRFEVVDQLMEAQR